MRILILGGTGLISTAITKEFLLRHDEVVLYNRGITPQRIPAGVRAIHGDHQRCWTHLLRDLHELKEAHTEQDDVVQWALAVRQLYDAAQTWLLAHPAPSAAERRLKYADLYQRACTLGQQYAFDSQHPCWALAKRLLRHQEELFQFVSEPGVPATNNLAERSLRPLVIMR